MRKILFILSATMVLCALASSAVLAAGGKIRFGNLALVPSMTVEEVHDDNIYYSHGGSSDPKKSDWITHYKPGLMLDYTIEGRGKFKFGYKGDYAYYDKNSDNDWKSHRLFLDLDYLSPAGLIVKIKNDLVHSEDPYGALNDYKLGTKSERWTDELKTAVGYKFSDRFKLLTYYNYYRQDYKNTTDNSSGSGYYGNGDYTQDYYEHEAGLGVEAKIAHKTWAFLRYHNGTREYFTHRDGITSSNDASYDWHRVNTGLEWDDGGKFAGEFNFGYQWNSFKNSHDLYGNPYKSNNDWIAGTRVHYKQVEGRTFTFTIDRSMQQLESGFNGYYTNTAIGIGVEQRIRTKFHLMLGYKYEKNKYTSEGYSSYYSYSSDNRKDTIHHVRAGLQYDIREWLYAGVEYNYTNDNSNDSSSGYKINRFGISLTFRPADYH